MMDDPVEQVFSGLPGHAFDREGHRAGTFQLKPDSCVLTHNGSQYFAAIIKSVHTPSQTELESCPTAETSYGGVWYNLPKRGFKHSTAAGDGREIEIEPHQISRELIQGYTRTSSNNRAPIIFPEVLPYRQFLTTQGLGSTRNNPSVSTVS